MRKLSRNEWIGVSVGVVLVAYTLFGGFIHDTFRQAVGGGSTSQTALGAPSDTSGLSVQTQDIVVGGGPSLEQGMLVDVYYILSLPDGTVVQDSRDVNNDEPMQFIYGVGQLIPGWEMGVSGMRVGGKRLIVIPPELGYGAQQVGPIPPNSTLIFQVEVVDAQKLQ